MRKVIEVTGELDHDGNRSQPKYFTQVHVVNNGGIVTLRFLTNEGVYAPLYVTLRESHLKVLAASVLV